MPPPLTESVLVTSYNSAKSVATLTLNRPKKQNALSEELLASLTTELARLNEEDDVRVVVITGSGKGFCAGLDIRELSGMTREKAEDSEFMMEFVSKFGHVGKPIIAAVNGLALGGGFELALMCDIIYAADSAIFGFPECRLGTIPGIGGTQRLSRIVGKGKAMEMVLTGEAIDAGEAKTLGVVCGVYKGEELVKAVSDKAESMAQWSPDVLRRGKSAVGRADYVGLDEGLKFERNLYYETFDTDAFKEGCSAFLEKRKPNFSRG